MKIDKELLDVQLRERAGTKPIMIVEHQGDVNAEIHMFVDHSENPEELKPNVNSNYDHEEVKNLIEQEYDITDYYSLLYGVSMKIDELGFYYIKGNIEDEEKVLADSCEKCGKEFNEDSKVYPSSKYSNKHVEYCRECKRKLDVAHQL